MVALADPARLSSRGKTCRKIESNVETQIIRRDRQLRPGPPAVRRRGADRRRRSGVHDACRRRRFSSAPSAPWISTSANCRCRASRSRPRRATVPMSACRRSCRARSGTTRSMCAPTASRSRRTSRASGSACRNTSSPPASGRASFLEHDHGVKPSDVIWVRGGIDDPTPAGEDHHQAAARRAAGERAGRQDHLAASGERRDRRLHRAARAAARRQEQSQHRLAVSRSDRGRQGLLQAHRHLPDHARHRHPPHAGRAASLAAGGGAQGVRAVEGEMPRGAGRHRDQQSARCRSSTSSSRPRAN